MPESDPISGPILLQLALIFLNAIFACSEIAVIAMNDQRLEKLAASGDRRAVLLSRLTEQPSRFLATIQIGITLVNLLGSAFAAENFADRLTALMLRWGVPIPGNVLHTMSLILITLVLTYFTVTVGELVPKRIAMKKADSIALGLSGLVYAVSRLFAPAVWFLTVSANGLLRLFGIDPHDEDSQVTEEEIRMMVDAGSEKGTIQPDEKTMIQNIFEFNDKTAEEVMTHRTDVALLWMDESDEQWQTTIYESRHSVYPICSESSDKIEGVLYAKDYFRLKDKSRENVMAHAVRPAYFVPETVRTDLLFRNMKKSRNHFAVVLDEYGGMSGIITMSDLLEQLVGDLEDDITVPAEPPPIERIDSRTWRVHGSAPLEDIARQLGVELPIEDYETFGGLVFGLLGTVPDDGSTPELEEFGLAVKVTKIEDHRLESALVTLVGDVSEPVPLQAELARNGK